MINLIFPHWQSIFCRALFLNLGDEPIKLDKVHKVRAYKLPSWYNYSKATNLYFSAVVSKKANHPTGKLLWRKLITHVPPLPPPPINSSATLPGDKMSNEWSPKLHMKKKRLMKGIKVGNRYVGYSSMYFSWLTSVKQRGGGDGLWQTSIPDMRN